MNSKPAPRMSLDSTVEATLRRNKEEAERLLGENSRIEAEMQRILSEPPPSRHTSTPPSAGTKMSAEKEVIYAALAICRSWQRRHKKNFHTQEKDLLSAVEKLTWEP